VKRHKEQLVHGLELSPLRLLGGFICIDFHFGCIGCNYCLNRRHPVLHQVLERGLQFDAGLDVPQLAAMLEGMPSFHRARVPLRVGHVSDWFYEKSETARFCAWLPDDYPAVLMTRFPLSAAQRGLVQDHTNLLVHLTVTPPHPGESPRFSDAAVDSTSTLARDRIIYMFRPLVTGDPAATHALLDRLPVGSFVAFKGLSTHNIPGLDPDQHRITPDEVLALRASATRRRLIPIDLFGCVFRERMGLPFFKHHAIRDLTADSHCHNCSNRSACEATLDPPPVGAIQSEVQRLGLSVQRVDSREGVLHVTTSEPSSRADEIYLSELFSRDIQLSSVFRGDGPGVTDVEGDVFRRQERIGFLPVAELRRLSAALESRVTAAPKAPHRRVLIIGRSMPEWCNDVWLARALEGLGHIADFFDVRMLAAQQDPVEVEDQLAERVRTGAFDLVLLTRGGILSETVLKQIRAHTHLHLHFVDINPASVAELAPLCHTTSASAPSTAQVLGGVQIVDGASPPVHFPGTPRERFASDLSFIGKPWANRQRLVTSLLRRGLAVRTFGSLQWAGHRGSPKVVGRDFRDVVASSAINLAIDPASAHPDFAANRVFLLLACEGFVLSHRFHGIEAFFENGKHLVWYETEDELVALARHYLDRPAERAAMAAEGRRHVLEHYTMTHTAQHLLDMVTDRT
jgi:hypothetical protein